LDAATSQATTLSSILQVQEMQQLLGGRADLMGGQVELSPDILEEIQHCLDIRQELWKLTTER
jgi:hypothetical protein